MELFFVDYLDRIGTLHKDYLKYLNDLSSDDLDWIPGDEMNSLCVIAIHVTAAEKYWIGMGVGDEIERDRSSEFASKGFTVDQLRQRFEDNLKYYQTALEDFSTDQFGEFREVKLFPDRIWTCTAGWALLHALDHTAEHLGHAGMTRQLLDRR